MFNFKYKNNDGLWVKVLTLAHNDASKPRIVLMPMMHVADKRYFEEMYYEEWCCDVVLLEGVNHPIGRMLNKFYAACAALKNIGAKAQHNSSTGDVGKPGEDSTNWIAWHSPQVGAPLECTSFLNYPEIDPNELKRAVRFVKADVSKSTARDSLKELPWWMLVLAPFAFIGALIMLRFQSRKKLIDEFSAEGHYAEKEDGGWLDAELNLFMKFATDTRDAHLGNVLLNEIESPANLGKTIGVKFGVGHMRPLLKTLRKTHGYQIASKRGVLAWAVDPRAQESSPNKCYGVAKEKYYDIMVEPWRKREAEKVAG